MLIHRLLGRSAPVKTAPAEQAAPVRTAPVKCYAESCFGVVLVESLCVQYRDWEELEARIRRALGIPGVNMVRVHQVEYRLNAWGEVYHTDMWGRGK